MNTKTPKESAPEWWTPSWFSRTDVGIALCDNHMKDAVECEWDDLSGALPTQFVQLVPQTFRSDDAVPEAIYELVESICGISDWDGDSSVLTPKVCYRCYILQMALVRQETDEVSDDQKDLEYNSLTVAQALIYNDCDGSHFKSIAEAWEQATPPSATLPNQSRRHEILRQRMADAQDDTIVRDPATLVRQTPLTQDEPKQKPKQKQVAKFVKKTATLPEKKTAVKAVAQPVKKVAKPIVAKVKSDEKPASTQPIKKVANIKKVGKSDSK